MVWRKAKNGNKCSCCSSSSSSSSGSGSDSSSSSESVSFSESSSSSSASASSSVSVGPLGSCCAIDRKYVIAEETYPENEYDEMKDWVRSQRQGREGVGLIFVGPVQLRTKEWYGAVVCMGDEEGGGCDCANIEDGWVCTEGVDALSCYLDGGVPGTGVFTEGGNCDEPCENPLLDCQVGCEGCGCCAAEAPPAGPDGVACTEWRQIVPYEILEYHYGEALTDPECPNGKMGEIMDYLATRGFDRQGLAIATFRTSDGKNCRVEIWGRPPSCDGESCPTVGQADEDPNWPGITAVPDCSPDACPELQCVEASDVDAPVMDEWQAGQIGGTWSDGDCPGACCPDETDCDDSVLVPIRVSKESGEANPDALDIADSDYLLMQPQTPLPVENQDFVWNEDYPDKLCNYRWITERVISNLAFFNTDEPYTGASNCYRAYLIACDPVAMEWVDVTSQAVTGLPGIPPGEQNIEVESLINWGLTGIFPFFTDETYVEGCNSMPSVDGFEYFYTGMFEETLPIPFGGEFREAKAKEAKEGKGRNVETRSLPAGPGTELKKLLKFLGLPDKPGCSCNKKAQLMDKWGWETCSLPEKEDEIISWLKQEAVKRKLPFVEWGARVIVRRAVRNARKAK